MDSEDFYQAELRIAEAHRIMAKRDIEMRKVIQKNEV